jgi:hypothetical protein
MIARNAGPVAQGGEWQMEWLPPGSHGSQRAFPTPDAAGSRFLRAMAASNRHSVHTIREGSALDLSRMAGGVCQSGDAQKKQVLSGNNEDIIRR